MDRRQFIKATALTGTSATLASCGNPEYHLIRFIPEDAMTPGIAVFKPSVCPLCSAGCGLTVRVMEGEAEVIRNNQLGVTKMGLAKKLEGDPAHPINRGKLCVRGQAAIQVTYHPDRLGHPLKRTGERFTGQFQEVTWDEALSDLVSKLDSLAVANDQKSLAFLTAPPRGLRGDLVTEFANRFGAPAPIAFEFFSNDVLRRANALSFGREQLPTFDFGESRYVIAFGADFLGTWNSPVSQSVGYGQMRQGWPGMRGKFVQVESRMSQTGANADEWVPMKPGLDGVLALGLAHVILKAGGRRPDAAGRAGTLIEGWVGGLAEYSPQEVEKRTGVATARIERLAKEFAEQRPAVALIGGAPLAQTNGLFSALAVNALNALVGSIETPGGIFFTPQVRVAQTRSIDQVADSNTQLLLVDGANPVFATPHTAKMRETLMKIPFIVSFGNFLDETSTLADLVLPDHSFLESWVESRPESGAKTAVASVAGPVMRPLHDTRAMPDVLLEVGRRLKKPLSPALPWQNFEEMVRNAEKSPAVIDRRYSDAARVVSFTEPQFDGDAGEYPFHFLPYASAAFLDGSTAHLPWLQELPDPLSSAMWSSWVEINPQTAGRLQIAQGDLVEITSSQGALRVPAFVSPGIAPDVIAMPVGQGHETFTRYASGRGENPISILALVKEKETGALAWAATRVKIAKAGAADGRLVLFAGSLRENAPEHDHR
ncbi:MAG TPA: molybdopterin-dependent oxidoreductase [Terriglobia bacterium]|nr:molybdopterin-dependent oxidoreductase [Terriglobia bacterium]